MSHQALISSLNLFYHTLVSLHYIKKSEIHQPPQPSGIHPNIDTTSAVAEGFSPEAADLLQRLPYLSPDLSDIAILPDSARPLIYLDLDDFESTRRATFQDEVDVKASHVLLTPPSNFGTVLVYDVETEKLFPWKTWGEGAPESLAEDCDELGWLTPEELVVEQWVKNLLSLTWLPNFVYGAGEVLNMLTTDEIALAKNEPNVLAQFMERLVRLTLRDVYVEAGWDVEALTLNEAKANFVDAIQWRQKEQAWKKRTQELLDRAYAENWDWERLRGEIGGAVMDSEAAQSFDVLWPEGYQTRHLEL